MRYRIFYLEESFLKLLELDFECYDDYYTTTKKECLRIIQELRKRNNDTEYCIIQIF